MRIAYGIQSTGKGHLSRFLGLLPYFEADGHELLVMASGYEDPPEYFLNSARRHRYARFRGVSYVGDRRGGVSELGTSRAFLSHLPGLLSEFKRAQRLLTEFAPHLIVSDFDPITGSRFVASGIPKVGLSHQAVLLLPGLAHPKGMGMAKMFTMAVVRMFTGGLDYRLGCHFYPANRYCLPPIIRPAIRDARVENRGHIVLYHTLPGLLGEIREFAAGHPDRRIIIYGYPAREDMENIHFENDRSKFASDLASADAYVGTAGFQSISEAFYLGKKIVVRPTARQYEQIWNAYQLEHWGMGRWARRGLEQGLQQEFNHRLHARLRPWFRHGARTCYEWIIGLAEPVEVSSGPRPARGG